MGKHTIYIKNDDEPKWQAISNKPEWLHEHLSIPGPMPVYAMEDIKAGQYGVEYVGKPSDDPTYEPMEPTV